MLEKLPTFRPSRSLVSVLSVLALACIVPVSLVHGQSSATSPLPTTRQPVSLVHGQSSATSPLPSTRQVAEQVYPRSAKVITIKERSGEVLKMIDLANEIDPDHRDK